LQRHGEYEYRDTVNSRDATRRREERLEPLARYAVVVSRNLYTIAVVAAEIESRLHSILDTKQPYERLIEAEDVLRDAVAGTQPGVAFYRVLLDGWNRTHAHFANVPADERSRWINDLDANGFAWPAAESLHPKSKLPASDRGAYTMRAMLTALNDASHFTGATGCATIVIWRVVGPSFDDSEFR
jgi:hypothetical protein